MADIDFFIEGQYPLLKIHRGTKIPSENWRDVELRNRQKEEFSNLNYGVRCGLKQEEGYLVVVDVDPKNGGDQTLKTLFAANDSFPPTVTVRTGSGGFHFYFLSKEPLKKCVLAKGIDLQGEGSYVVGAGSLHENGNIYQLIDDSELADLPSWVLDEIPKKESSKFFDATAYSKPEKYVQGDGCYKGGRNNALTAEAGALRRIGMSQDAIFACLMVINREKCEPPLPTSELKTIAWSASKYQPEIEPEPIPLAKIETPKSENTDGYVSTANLQREFDFLFSESQGLIKEIATTIKSHARIEYNQFALGAALGILSSCAQASFEVSSLNRPGVGETRLSLYQWFVADSAAGKDAYREMISKYLDKIDSKFVSNRFGSHYGMRSLLFAWNSLVALWDEMQDEMTRLSKGGQHLNQILTEIKELYNGPNRISAMVIKDRVYPGINKPRLSVMGFGTIAGFKSHLTGDVIGGGLISRFQLVPIFKPGMISRNIPLTTIPKDQIDRLKAVFEAGRVNPKGHGASYEDLIQNFGGIDDGNGRKKSAPEHSAQSSSSKNILNFDEDAEQLIRSFQDRQQAKYIEMASADEITTDLSPASVIARSVQVAIKIAGLHAISRDSMRISIRDVQWGIQYATVSANCMARLVQSDAGETPYDRKRNKVLNSIAGFTADKPGSLRDVLRRTRLQKNEVEPIIIDLSLCQLIAVSNSDGMILDLELCNKLPRGCSLYKI